ncbi:FHA domain-containing protein [Blautia sp. M29]|uniref:FHA domain-containing protein n=2 Tax=Blautia difficilis TaxID=2763027 RepID=A0ABR7IGV2_9FIRM|nr:FHA domain-containing protein [Blautia difficilis]
MKAEYKRDMNHNYLILYGEKDINTDSYQVRMLVGNIIPSLLKCRIQGVDGKFMMYFDITSKQAVSTLYEEKKLGNEDLRLIFGGFVRVMEEAAEYLINPAQLVLKPQYIFADCEKKELFFCLMPGYDKDIKEQFQLLTEYILPKIDHEDSEAVILGYGVYRRTMENSFHLEHIKEELYRKQNNKEEIKTETEKDSREISVQETGEESLMQSSGMSENFWREEKTEKTDSHKLFGKKVAVFVLILLALAGVTMAISGGYLPHQDISVLLGVVLAGMGGIMLAVLIIRKAKDVYKQPQRESREKPQLSEKFVRPPVNEILQEGSDDSIKTMMEKKSLHREREEDFGETVVLSAGVVSGPASLVSREPGELAPIYLQEELTVIGKLENACDAVIDLPTVSRIHAKIRKREEEYYLSDMNSRNGTIVNGRLLLPEEEYRLQEEDEVDFAQARYIFLK